MRKFKSKATPDTLHALTTRFNKALVCAQLRGMFDYEKDEDLYADCEKIFNHWSATSKVPGDRPRFLNVKELFNIEEKVIILTSSYTTFFHDAKEYTIFTISYKGYVEFGLPMIQKVTELLGGPNVVARIIAHLGLQGLITELINISAVAESYEDKDRIAANLKLLQEFEGGIYHG